MLNLDLSLVLVLASVAGPTGADSHAAAPAHQRTMSQLRGAPPPPPPQQQPGLRGAPPPPPQPQQPPPPPPPRQERVAPRPGFVWIEGNYEWRGGRYLWIGGRWEAERSGKRWRDGRWDRQGDRYIWISGEWFDAPVYITPRVYVEQPPAPPPPPPVPVQPEVRTRPGFIWVPGAQEWRDGRYVWVEGHWEKERRGHRWHPGRWEREGNRHYWRAGDWERDGDGDRDYRGSDGDHDRGRRDRDRDGDHDRGRRDRDHDRGNRGAALSISGRVLARDGQPIVGVTVVLAGTSEARAVTGPDGSYSFTGLGYGSYAVRPSAGGCSFGPDVVNLNNLSAPVVQDFYTGCNWRETGGGRQRGR